jgi:hypothetical protein
MADVLWACYYTLMAGHQSQPEGNQLAVALETAVAGRATLHVKAAQGPLWMRFALFASDAVVAAVHHMAPMCPGHSALVAVALPHMALKYYKSPGNCHMLDRSPGVDLHLQGTPAASSQSIIPTPHPISILCVQLLLQQAGTKKRSIKKNKNKNVAEVGVKASAMRMDFYTA